MLKRAISILLTLATPAFGAETIPISGLPRASTPLIGTEQVPIVQGGVTRKISALDLGATAIKPFSGVASQWPWQLASDGTWTLKQPGATDVTFTQSGTGAVARTVGAKLSDYIIAADYGVKCDNSTDDTAALSVAFTAAAALKKNLFVQEGTCLTTGLTYTSASYANQFSILGAGHNLTIIKKTGAGSSPVLTLGSSSATNFMSDITIRGITFDGASFTTTDAIRAYDLVRSRFDGVVVKNAQNGLHLYGGISIDIKVEALSNQIGVRAETFSSLAGGGVPNAIWIHHSVITGNSLWGVNSSGGTLLNISDSDIESNGTTLASSQGGVYVSAVSGEMGANIRSTWFEGNKGIADIWFNGGVSTSENNYFFSTALEATYDIQATAGNYYVKGGVHHFAKTPNIYESAGAGSGNLIAYAKGAAVTIDTSKTALTTTTAIAYPQPVTSGGDFASTKASDAGGGKFGTNCYYGISANSLAKMTLNASGAYSLVDVTTPFAFPTYTIAGLPACSASLLGSGALVSNGTAFGVGTYGSAVSATGAVTRKVICTNTGGPTTYAWAYD